VDIENKSLQIAIEAIRAEERERCAKIADGWARAWKGASRIAAETIAEDIRHDNQTP